MIAASPARFVWLMGLANATYSYAFAVVLVTVPQLLRERGMAEPAIASLTALAYAAGLCGFVLAPLLDTMISRRAWAISLALATAVFSGLTLGLPVSSALVAPALVGTALATLLFNTALGGWLAAALPKSCDEAIGTWFAIGNAAGFGVGAVSQHWLMTALPAPWGALAVMSAVLVPLAIVPLIPAPDIARKAMRESFGHLARDVVQLVRQPLVLRVLVMFILPCAAFTLTNAFAGLGPDFHASATQVDFINGVGATAIGVAASLLGRWLVNILPAAFVYLGIGVLGAGFTGALLALPHTPGIYSLAVLGENAAQSLAQVAQNTIIFRSIRQGSPLAATQFGLLGTAFAVPYAYMQWLDGRGYAITGSVAGQFLMDAGASLAACALIAVPVWRWVRSGKLEAPEEPIPRS